ncbi:hypothetical protein BLSTO_06031 [Blastocystis sp. subtype 1]
MVFGKESAEEDDMKKKRREREIKMNLIKLKAASRTIYGELYSIMEKIEKEMQSSDTLLVDLNRMESEISSMKRTLVNYQSFSTPAFDSVEEAAGKVRLTEEDGDTTLFHKRRAFLEEEKRNRKKWCVVCVCED